MTTSFDAQILRHIKQNRRGSPQTDQCSDKIINSDGRIFLDTLARQQVSMQILRPPVLDVHILHARVISTAAGALAPPNSWHVSGRREAQLG